MSNYSNLTPWPHCEVIWYHRTWSTLVQAIASCHMSPSHYLYHCWLIVTWTIWNILEWNFSQNAFFFRKMYLKMLSAKCQSLCSGLSRIMIRKLHYHHQKFSTIYSLKEECYHHDEIFFCCNRSCQMPIFNAELQRQWYKFLLNNSIFISVYRLKFTRWVEAPISSLCSTFVLQTG